MKVIGFNGSPRKNWNTSTLLIKALEGAASKGAETELINLYELNYRGCTSCYACKMINGKSYGRCATRDGLTDVLNRVRDADAVIFGSPIYIGGITGEMKCFLERLIFPYLVYDKEKSSLFPRKIPTGFIYTMNVNEAHMKEMEYEQNLKRMEITIKRIFGSFESLLVTDTYQFDDYSKYYAPAFNEEDKAKVRRSQFPIDCMKAFEMGARFAD